MANGKTYSTKRKAKKAVKKANPGKKVVTVNKRTIKKYGSSITKKSVKAGYGKKKQATGKGKVKRKIKYVAPVSKPKKAKTNNGRKKKKKKSVKSRALL